MPTVITGTCEFYSGIVASFVLRLKDNDASLPPLVTSLKMLYGTLQTLVFQLLYLECSSRHSVIHIGNYFQN